MDPNQWNTYNLQYGHPGAGSLPQVHHSLNRLDLTSAGLSHQLQAGRAVPSLQAVNYQALSGLPILDTFSPLTTGLSAQGHQLVFDPQSNRLSSEPQVAASNQPLPSPHRLDTSTFVGSKQSNTRPASDNVGRAQFLEAARLWTTQASNFSSPSSLYSQFNAALFPQSSDVSSVSSPASPSPSHTNISSASKISHSQILPQQQEQQHHLFQEPPPAHSANASSSLRLLPAVQRPAQQFLHSGSSEHYNFSRTNVSSSASEIRRQEPHFTTHKAVVLGVGSAGLAQLQHHESHRQTPVPNQHHNHHQHNDFSSHRIGSVKDLSSGHSQNQYSSYSNLQADSNDFGNNVRQSHHSQQNLLSAADLNYEAVSPTPSVHQQLQQQQQNMDVNQHHGLSFNLAQFSELTPENAAHILADKFQSNDMRPHHGNARIQPHQGASDVSVALKIPAHHHYATATNQFQQSGGMVPTSANMSSAISAGRHTPQSIPISSTVSPSASIGPGPTLVQAMADSTTKPKRPRSRKKKNDAVSSSVSAMTSSNINVSSGNSLALSGQLQQPGNHSLINTDQIKKSALFQVHQAPQQLQFSQASGTTTTHISTLSMASSDSPQLPFNYGRAQTPSMPQNYSLNDQLQLHSYQHNVSDNSKNSNQDIQQLEHPKTANYNKQPQPKKKSPVKMKSVNPSISEGQIAQTFQQQGINLSQQNMGPSMQDSHGRMVSYNSQQLQKLAQSSSHQVIAGDGTYSKLLGQNPLLVANAVSYADQHQLHERDHLLEENENVGSTQQQPQHYAALEFSSQPFLEQLAGVSGTGEVVLTDLDGQPTYHGAPVENIQSGAQVGSDQVQFSNSFFPSEDCSPLDQGSMQEQLPPAPEPEMTLTFVPHIVEDEELGHFACPEESVPMSSKQIGSHSQSSGCGKDSFQNSFLNYIQGHKQETLSSVSSSAVTKKPQLPKYIPEPPRPKPPPAPPTPKSIQKPAIAQRDTTQTVRGDGETISTLSNMPSQKTPGDKEGYSVQRTSDLAMKITLPKNKNKSRFGPFAESTLLKDSMHRNKERKRKKGKFNEDDKFLSEDLEEPKPSTPPPTRTSIGRKAKDKCIERTKKHNADLDSEEEILQPKKKGYNSDDSLYNSDEDPAWKPFDVDLNPGDFVEKRKKPRRQRPRVLQLGEYGQRKVGSSKAAGSKTYDATSANVVGHLKIGTYMIEEADLVNPENYPIWRMEENNRLKKFNITVENDQVVHQASGEYSLWKPSMDSQYETIKVREIEVKEGSGVTKVQVLEEFRPKSFSDSRLDGTIEEDPLVDAFNIYLQVFLSQALEPNFLAVIQETNEMFYLDALNQIDGMIEKKCDEITKFARWKTAFKVAIDQCPLMKEIDRPNLKQACQASENPSSPSIKSVVLSGSSYDRFLLTEMQGSSNPQEFSIGKVAAHYVRAYHSLYHFKYWLRQRCDAKVKTTKESNKSEHLTDEVVLDKCLENRNWVLQLFSSLKSLLRNDADAPR